MAASTMRRSVNIHWIESEDIERQGTERILREADGILVPGGFGARGIEGKIDHDPLCAGTAVRSSACASACSAPRSNSHATSPA